MTESVTLKFTDLAGTGVLATVAFNRPEAANSFNKQVIASLTAHFKTVAARTDCRIVILTGQGKHFSAGADLAWMQEAAKLDHQGNLADAVALAEMFESFATLPMPTVAVVRGSAYGGAVGLCAAADMVIASDKSRFALSEVRLGLIPAVILPYLGQKMALGELNRLALSGQVFNADSARALGLVQRVVSDESLTNALREEINALLAADPVAQRDLKVLLSALRRRNFMPGPDTSEAIAKRRVHATAQAGLSSFFAKKPAPWQTEISPEWTVF